MLGVNIRLRMRPIRGLAGFAVSPFTFGGAGKGAFEIDRLDPALLGPGMLVHESLGGAARLGSSRRGAVVAVLHNAIKPHRSLAALAAEVAMDVLRPDDEPDEWITFRRGTRLLYGPKTAVVVDGGGLVDRIYLEDPKFLTGRWSLGIGHQVPVVRDAATPVGEILYEPYIVVEAGTLLSLDGQDSLSVPVRRTASAGASPEAD